MAGVNGGAQSVMTGLVPVTHIEPPHRRPRFSREPCPCKQPSGARDHEVVTGTSPVMTETTFPLASRIGSDLAKSNVV